MTRTVPYYPGGGRHLNFRVAWQSLQRRSGSPNSLNPMLARNKNTLMTNATPLPPTARPGRSTPMSRRLRSGMLLVALLPLHALACSGRLHIEVPDSGVYALDYASIVAQQPGLKDCASDTLALLNHGVEVPLRIIGDDNGRFGAGARIEWVGQALHGPQSWFDPYSTVNVYQLAAQPGTHARMHEVAGGNAAKRPASLTRLAHFEQENFLLRLSDHEMKRGDEPDVWQWAKLTPVDPKPFSFAFDLPDAAVRDARGAEPAALTVAFHGVSSAAPPAPGTKQAVADHRVDVTLNGKALPPQEWMGIGNSRAQLQVPRSLLKPKGNTITIQVPKRTAADDPKNFVVDVVMLNWIELRYPVEGNLDADTSAFTASDGAPVELVYSGSDAPELLDADGGYQHMSTASAGHYRGVAMHRASELFAATNASIRRPETVRPISDVDPRRADPGYDYVIVAHPRLLQAIEPLAAYHREHGHRVAVFNVDDLYDDFNGGIAHPSAIRDALAWGHEHWQVKPRYLLLVGDASNDIRHDIRSERLEQTAFAARPHPLAGEMLNPRGFVGMPTTLYPAWNKELPNRNLIPTWQVPSLSYGQSASDNPYATLDARSIKPDIAVGRFPVVEPQEVDAIVAKTIEYLEHPAPGPWHRDMVFISTDEVASFKKGADEIATSLDHQGFGVDSIYTKVDAEQAVLAHDELKKQLNAGSLLVHFIGHGGQYIWRVGPPADLFTLEDVSKLTNAGRYPMVLAMTCFSAPFDNPTADSIGERLLREPNKGAVAVFAASWTNSPNPQYSKQLIGELLKVGNPIGDAIVAAKARIQDPTFVETYNLLGDPALVLARPREALQFMRAGSRWEQQVIVRVPERDFGGYVRVEWADANGQTVAAHDYEARDSQFTIDVPKNAVELRAFANNLRTGYLALGDLALVDTPKKEPDRSFILQHATNTANAKPNAQPAPVPASRPQTAAPPPPQTGRLPDKIGAFGFDDAVQRVAQHHAPAKKTPSTAAAAALSSAD